MKKNAFTLAEILIVLIIMGIIAVMMIANIKSDGFSEKANIAKAYKVINAFDEAAGNIRDINNPKCPTGSFIYRDGKNANGTYGYSIGLVLPASNKEQAVLDIFGEFIKFEKTGLNFCDYTKYCDSVNASAASDSDKITNVPAAKFSKDIYAGIKILPAIENCPDFYLPESDVKLTPRTSIRDGAPKCWAKLYVDVNGIDAPNTLGKDVFVFGLDEFGVYH